VDTRSDLYALGVVGFFALSGRLPFDAVKPIEVLAKQVTEPAPPLQSVATGVPRRLASMIDWCLEKDPADRPQTGEELAEQLAIVLQQRKDIPVVLRAFVKHNCRLDGAGVLLAPFGVLFAAASVGAALGDKAAFATLVGTLIVLPLAILVNRARRLLQAGFGYGDIGVAFRAEIEQQREERAVDRGRGPSRLERVLRVGALVGLGGAALSMIVVVTGIGYPWGYDEFGPYGLMLVGILVGLGSGLPVLMMLQRRRDVDTEAYARFWTGSIGRWLFGLAGSFTSTRSLPAAMTHRPTELSIGMAAERLFATLPKETRHQVRGLPDVVHRLEEDAQRMRRRLEDLNEALAGPAAEHGQGTGGDGAIETRRRRIVVNLQAERDLVQQRLNDALKALESIRLNLLRLHAGSGSVHSLTTDLGLAREVARELGFLLEAEREIEQSL